MYAIDCIHISTKECMRGRRLCRQEKTPRTSSVCILEKSGGKLEDRYFEKCICSNKVLEYILIVIFYRFTSFYFHSLTVRSLLNNLR